jgi:hypothetical protein
MEGRGKEGNYRLQRVTGGERRGGGEGGGGKEGNYCLKRVTGGERRGKGEEIDSGIRRKGRRQMEGREEGGKGEELEREEGEGGFWRYARARGKLSGPDKTPEFPFRVNIKTPFPNLFRVRKK